MAAPRDRRPVAEGWGGGGYRKIPAIVHFCALAKRAALPADFRQKVRGIIAPGTTLVTTDTATNPAKPGGSEED